MTSAPPQGFVSVLLDIESRTEEENSRNTAKDISLMDQNNALLTSLINQIELITNVENIDGDNNLNGTY